MEPRMKTILPIAGVVIVIIIALVAFFVTRRVSDSNTSPSPSATIESDLIVPASSGSPKPSASANPRTGVTRVPNTGVNDKETNIYTTVIDDQGFRDADITVAKGTVVAWLNLGSQNQTITLNGQVKTITPNNQITQVVNQTVTVVSPSTNTKQMVMLQ